MLVPSVQQSCRMLIATVFAPSMVVALIQDHQSIPVALLVDPQGDVASVDSVNQLGL